MFLQHFQEIEEAHLIQMKDFLRSYCDVIQRNHDLVGQVHSEFRQQCLDMTVEKMMETFCLSKYTGLEKPSNIVACKCGPASHSLCSRSD